MNFAKNTVKKPLARMGEDKLILWRKTNDKRFFVNGYEFK